MKFAYSSLACPQWTIEEAIEAAVRYGYDAIEWRMADGEIITSETPEQCGADCVKYPPPIISPLHASIHRAAWYNHQHKNARR